MNFHITRYSHPDQKRLEDVLSLRSEFGEKDSPEPFASFVRQHLENESVLLILAWVDDVPVGYGLAFGVGSIPSCLSGPAPGLLRSFWSHATLVNMRLAR